MEDSCRIFFFFQQTIFREIKIDSVTVGLAVAKSCFHGVARTSIVLNEWARTSC